MPAQVQAAPRLPVAVPYASERAPRMNDDNEPQSLGVFKPVGHVVISFPEARQAAAARQALGASFAADAVRALSDLEMLAQSDADLDRASPLAEFGQELNLVRAHRVLAERGYHWLVVRVRNDEQAAQVAEIAREHGAERAQHYGHFVIEELIDRPGDMPQVGESPDRGLDAQTPSGLEADAARAKAGATSRR